METKYIKEDFHLTNHRSYNGSEYLNFINPSINHRYSGLVHNNKIGIKNDTCNRDFETCSFLSRLDSWVRFINSSLNNYRNYYHTDTSIIQFNTIEEANSWFDFMYDLIVSNDLYYLSTFLNNKALPKGIIMCSSTGDYRFKFYKVNEDFTLSEYDFEVEYNKTYKHTPNDLYKYDFTSMCGMPNLECKTWVSN